MGYIHITTMSNYYSSINTFENFCYNESMEDLKTLRKKSGLTQEEASKLFSVSRKTYNKYENKPDTVNQYQYKSYCEYFRDLTKVDEDHGILSIDEIKTIVTEVLDKYDVKSCTLFGSYAKGMARDDSDIDLVIDCSVTGLDFFGLIEELRESLHKRVDLLDIKQLLNNQNLISEVLKEGIRIYG